MLERLLPIGWSSGIFAPSNPNVLLVTASSLNPERVISLTARISRLRLCSANAILPTAACVRAHTSSARAEGMKPEYPGILALSTAQLLLASSARLSPEECQGFVAQVANVNLHGGVLEAAQVDHQLQLVAKSERRAYSCQSVRTRRRAHLLEPSLE
eukprot:CAMPEP_0169118728 /NCGR_PEP_ID=MMETSP1015-20121227/31156_1 /TAXON_ID=342587 /ORGANISM="Karlodinium micrum, Strain CCMP2283" /LENGTH=156 /DNA_ID=CAMNT_0009181517 /DNA_START=577 /DNA_END=1045 /DNA_ORIENTATION=+